jgi:hypothetical protein
MGLIGRDRDWTIYFRDGASEPPAVHPGHDRPDYEGWQRMEVVRADAYRGAVEDRDAAYRQRDRYYLALRLAVGADAVSEWLARAHDVGGQYEKRGGDAT